MDRHSITAASGAAAGLAHDSLAAGSCASVIFRRRCSSVAEQLIRNQQVAGSSPAAGSNFEPTNTAVTLQELPRRLPEQVLALILALKSKRSQRYA